MASPDIGLLLAQAFTDGITPGRQTALLGRVTQLAERSPELLRPQLLRLIKLFSPKTGLPLLKWLVKDMLRIVCATPELRTALGPMWPGLLRVVQTLLARREPALQMLGLESLATLYAHSARDSSEVRGLKAEALRIWRDRSAALGPRIAATRALGAFVAADGNAERGLDDLVTAIFMETSADVIMAIVAVLAVLLRRSDAATATLIVTALTSWAPPTALRSAPPFLLKSTEKAVRIALMAYLRSYPTTPHYSAITHFFDVQSLRMERAEREAEKREAEKREAEKREAERREAEKREAEKREAERKSLKQTRVHRTEPPLAPSATRPRLAAATTSQPIDVLSLPLAAVADAIVQALSAVPMDVLVRKTTALEESLRRGDSPTVRGTSSASVPRSATPQSDKPVPAPGPVSAPIDPLALDLGDDEIVPTKVDEPVEEEEEEEEFGADAGPIAVPDAAVAEMDALPKTILTDLTLRRLLRQSQGDDTLRTLGLRLVTRGQTQGSEVQQRLRNVLFEYATAGNKLDFARYWLAEEWHLAHATAASACYTEYAQRLVEFFTGHVTATSDDGQFARFIVDLPQLDDGIIKAIDAMCDKAWQAPCALATLRDVYRLRPNVNRGLCVDVALSCCGSADAKIRNTGITFVQKWLSETPELKDAVVQFATDLVDGLCKPKKEEPSNPVSEEDIIYGEKEEEEDVEMGEEGGADTVETIQRPTVEKGHIASPFSPPATKLNQHIDLVLGLAPDIPQLFTHLVELYPSFSDDTQAALQVVLIPVIKTWGAGSEALQGAIRNCPPGSEALIEHILTFYTERGQLSPELVQVLRELARKRQAEKMPLPPRFYLKIINDCNKEEVLAYVPHIVSLLGEETDHKSAIRSLFLSVVTPLSRKLLAAGAPNRVVTPVELLTLLHQPHPVMTVKIAIEAIKICFSMTETFKADVVSSFMLTTVESDRELPMIFMRTALQALTSYPTLKTFVSSTLLSRLIARKVWNNPPIWMGFVRCVKILSPMSLSVLNQLPKEQVDDILKKEPSLVGPYEEKTRATTAAVTRQSTPVQ